MKAIRYLEPLAMFMICLIISLPIYISSVYAGINQVRVYGTDGTEGFVERQYDMSFEASVSGNVSKEQIKLKHDSGLYTNFDSCTGLNNSFICSVRITRGTNSEVEVCPSAIFNVDLNDADGVLIDTKSISVKCDYLAPIIAASISPEITRASTVLSYTLQDPESAASRCSGINKIEFYTDSISGAATLLPNVTGCSYSNSYTINAAAYSDGKHTILIKAYDKLGNNNVANASFFVDKTAPSVAASAALKDISGNPILYFKPQNVLADIVLNITDLTGISSYNLVYASITGVQPSCENYGTSIVCRWNNIQIYITNATFTKAINVQATDALGNNASLVVPLNFAVPQDTVMPTIAISNITVGTADGSQMEWFKPRNMKLSFSADVSDDLSGIESVSGDFSNLQVISGDIPSCAPVGTSYRCTWSDLEFYASTANFNKQIRIIAVDNAGNQKIETKSVTFNYKADNSAPTLSNFNIVRADGQNLTGWIGDFTIAAKAYVDVSEKGSGLDSVMADFSSLNPGYISQIAGSCTKISGSQQPVTNTNTVAQPTGLYRTYSTSTGNSTPNITLPEYGYRCMWNINIHFETSGNPYTANVAFNATDKSFNSAGSSFSQAFQVDIDGPIVTGLITGYPYNGLYYVGTNSNSYIAAISDSGVGMSTSKAYLDLTSVGFGSDNAASRCSDGYCYWETAGSESISEGAHIISVNTNTQDDLKNRLAQPFYANVTYHGEKPVVKSINVSAVAASSGLFQNYIQTGNALYIVVSLTETASLLSATADFSGFIMNETNVLSRDCARSNASGANSNEWTCIWSTNAIDIKSYKKGNIYFNFTDIAGNNAVVPYELTVYEAMTGVYDYWDNIKESNSPTAIDKQLITVRRPSMWFIVGLTSKEGKSASERWPLDVSVETCIFNSSASSGTSSANYISSANGNKPLLVNPNGATPTSLPYHLYLDYQLEQTLPTGDSLVIPCQIKIRTLVDGMKISPYETENVSVTINYYNNPLGTLDERVLSEIRDVQDSWIVDMAWMDTIEQILNIARTVCQLFQHFNHIILIWAFVTGGFAKCAAAPGGAAICGPAQQISATGKDVTKASALASWVSFGNQFCAVLNCKMWETRWGNGAGIMGGWANIQKYVSTWGLKNSVTNQPIKVYEPKDSLILSIFSLCLPGVVYNLQKARIIECQYINCLKSTANGVPVEQCVKQRDYGWCKYVYGEIFNLIPFANIIGTLLQNIRKALSHPLEMIGFLVDIACSATCRTPGIGATCYACTSLEMFNWFLDILCDLGVGEGCEGFWEELTVNDSVCKDALKKVASSTSAAATNSPTLNTNV